MSTLVFDARVAANEAVAGDLRLLRLATPHDLSHAPAGAFLHLKVDDGPLPLFRRAYSILSADAREVELLYKVVGTGTRCLSRRVAGDVISVVGPLGNGFRRPEPRAEAVLVAGGVGLPPVLRWARELLAAGTPARSLSFIYGARREPELVLRSRVDALGVSTHYATDDGSFGHPGRVTELLRREIEQASASARTLHFYACGPDAMLRECSRLALEMDVDGELALETPMPCGTGVCLGCVVPCRAGDAGVIYRRTCTDGPILSAREVLWP